MGIVTKRTKRDVRWGKIVGLLALLGAAGCAAPDALDVAMEQRTVTYVSGTDYAPSTVR